MEEDSSESDANEINAEQQIKVFDCDYYLSNSLDIFHPWRQSLIKYQNAPSQKAALLYLQQQASAVLWQESFRSATSLRIAGFLHVLAQAFSELLIKYQKLFPPAGTLETPENTLSRCRELQAELLLLIGYMEHRLIRGPEGPILTGTDQWPSQINQKLKGIFHYVINPYALWESLCMMQQVSEPLTLGGTNQYYQQALRTLLKRSSVLADLYGKLSPSLQKPDQLFPVRLLGGLEAEEVRSKADARERREFAIALKGLYFLRGDFRNRDLFHSYLFTSLHIDHLQQHRKFRDHRQLEALFLSVLSDFKHSDACVPFVLNLEVEKIPFCKRQNAPAIQQASLDIVHNYIASARRRLGQPALFKEVQASEEWVGTRWVLCEGRADGLIKLLTTLQQNSKEAFALGGLDVHRAYLQITRLLRAIYLSFEHDYWLFPSCSTVALSLSYFTKISEDVRADAKRALYQMVGALSEDRLPLQLASNGNPLPQKVSRGEYLQVVLWLLEDCRREQEYINLPEVVPNNLETAVLFVKSLEARLSNKEPNEQQKPYLTALLKSVEQYKLKIKFGWYETGDGAEERALEFRIEKGLPVQWARKIVRDSLNRRDTELPQQLLQKYVSGKIGSILNVANALKFSQGMDPFAHFDKRRVRQQDLFLLLEELKMMLSLPLDLFALNQDEEATLNYIHVCLALYNSVIEQAPGNQAYVLIFHHILAPYINNTTSAAKRFREAFPSFFSAWIYSFQIPEILSQLSNSFQNHELDLDSLPQLIAKVRYVGDILKNNENIKNHLNPEQLTEGLLLFASILSSATPPTLYLEAAQLFATFLNRFPLLKQQTSLDFLISSDIFAEPKFLDAALVHVRIAPQAHSQNYQENTLSVLTALLASLPAYMSRVDPSYTFTVIKTYMQLRGVRSDTNLSQFTSKILQIKEEADSPLSLLMRFLIQVNSSSEIGESLAGLFAQNSELQDIQLQRAEALKQTGARIRRIHEQGHLQLPGVSFTDIPYLQQVLEQLDTKHEGQTNKVGREILNFLLNNLGSNSDRIFFADKLNMNNLMWQEQESDPRASAILVDLIVQNYHRQAQTELIRKLARTNKNLGVAAQRAVEKLKNQGRKVFPYHINRLIQVNNRYPNSYVQKFILKHLGEERNPTPAKIHQRFLVSDISRLLAPLPTSLAYSLLLEPLGPQAPALTESVSQIFQKLLYLPLGKFDKEKLKLVAQVDEGQDEQWESEGEGQTEPVMAVSKKKKDQSESEYDDGMGDMDESIEQDSHMMGQYEGQQQDCRPDYLQVFTEQDKKDQLKHYELAMLQRQELDVYLDSDYSKLEAGSPWLEDKYVMEKVINLVKILGQIDHSFLQVVCSRFPPHLLTTLTTYGLVINISHQIQEILRKRREPTTKKPKFLDQFFSERQESDDSQVADQQSDGWQEQSWQEQQQKSEAKVQQKMCEDELQIPDLVPTHSKIQEEVGGGELKSQELVKILDIALYQLLFLPHIHLSTRHITSFYIDILESAYGQMFLESCLTVLRFEEGKGLEGYLKNLGLDGRQVGLQGVSVEQGVINILHLLKEIQSREKRREMLFGESGSLLPIAQDVLSLFDIPLQGNCTTLLMFYIDSRKQKLRNRILQLDYGGGEKKHNFKSGELARVIERICRQGASIQVWEVLEGTMSLKIPPIPKLFACIKGYGGHLLKKLADTGLKIIATIEASRKEKKELASLESSYHVVSKLVLSCKTEIKQFYYINKDCVRAIFSEEDNLPDEDVIIKHLPKLLAKHKEALMASPELINLTTLVFSFIKLIKDQFHGKIQDKLFNRLVHYPKLVVEASWLYVAIYAEHTEYIWSDPAQVQTFFQNHKVGAAPPFKHLQEACNLVLHFLGLDSFCSDKFKQILIPVFMRQPQIGRKIPLRFKVPRVDDEADGQNILVTRRCSFDMAFYQLHRKALTVQFYGEEGSDHGGLVRELMIGWKGKGVGEEDFFLGKILGISFRQGVPYGGALDIAMVMAITNYTPTIEFFRDYDNEIYRSLVYIRDNDPEDLSLKFSLEKLVNGKLVQFQLVVGGRQIDLVASNKHLYLQNFLQKYFVLGRQHELSELRGGFNSIVYQSYAQIFTPVEMLKQIRGEEVVDVKMLKGKAKYEQGYSEQSPIIKWLWQLIQGFQQEQMNKFIQFVTGSPKITVFNSSFSITIEKVYDVACLPVAHTCFNTLDLPQYASKQILTKKLSMAINEGNNSFGIL